MLEIKNLHAGVSDNEILKDISLSVNKGEIHAIMGPNGSGKSSFSKVLAGHDLYNVLSGSVTFMGKNLLEMSVEERALSGIFLGFQNPIEVPGVSNSEFLRLAYNAKQVFMGKEAFDPLDFDEILSEKMDSLGMDNRYKERSLNEGFSGGEKKKNEILQLALLEPKLAILDEIDSGLDIDALRLVAKSILTIFNENKGSHALILITHYNRLLEYIQPDFVHILNNGKIVRSGSKELAIELEEKGYDSFISQG